MTTRTPARGRPAPRTKPKARPRERLLTADRRAQLIALGLEAFGVRPYDEVSIDDLAREASISKGLLYHYFPTKRDFYVAALREAARQLLAETASDPRDEPLVRARKGLAAYLAFVERHGPAYAALMRGGIGSDEEVSGVIQATRAALVERILSEPHGAQVPGTPAVRLALFGWVGFVEATALQWLEARAVSRERLLAMWAEMLVHAVEMAARPHP